MRLAATRIHWEQPALAYTVQVSVDGTTYMWVPFLPFFVDAGVHLI